MYNVHMSSCDETYRTLLIEVSITMRGIIFTIHMHAEYRNNLQFHLDVTIVKPEAMHEHDAYKNLDSVTM